MLPGQQIPPHLRWFDPRVFCPRQLHTPTVPCSTAEVEAASPRTTNNNYHLDYGSPCIHAANGPVAPDYDQDGYGRFDDPNSPNTGVGPPWADMGAYEFQPSWWW